MKFLAFFLAFFLPATALAFPNHITSGLVFTPNYTSNDLALTSNFLIYSSQANNLIGVISLSTGIETSSLPGINDPRGLAAKIDGTIVYVAEKGANQVRSVKIDPLSFTTPLMTGFAGPFGLALSDSTLLVTNNGSTNVIGSDTSSGNNLFTVTVGAAPMGIAANSGGTRIYVADTGGTVITTSSQQTGQISPGQVFIDVAASGQNRAYFIDTNGTIHVFEGSAVIDRSISLGGTPQFIAVHPSVNYDYVYVTQDSPLPPRVTIIEYPNPSTTCPGFPRIIQNIGVPAPRDIVVSSDGTRAYIANATTTTKSITVLEQRYPLVTVDPNNSCVNNSTKSFTTVKLTSDSSGSYSIERGGTGITGCGTALKSGSITAGVGLGVTIQASELSPVFTNTTYTLYAFVTDSSDGRTGSQQFNIKLITVPPGNTTNLQTTSKDTEVDLTWAQTEPSSNVVGYYVYFTSETGDSQRRDTQSASPSYAVKGLQNKVLYYFTVTAYDCAGNEGSTASQAVGYPFHVPGPAERSGEKGGCFIATEVFGPQSFEVNVLQTFRDKYLLSSEPGKWFVSMYYRYSPSVAAFIHGRRLMKGIIRPPLVLAAFSAWLFLEGRCQAFLILICLLSGILFAFNIRKWRAG